MKNKIVKYSYLFLLPLFSIISHKSNAQYTQITFKDTINQIHNLAFQYIKCYPTKINLQNFQTSIKNNASCITYRTFDSSTSLFNSMFNTRFKRVLFNSVIDTSIIMLCTKQNNNITFSEGKIKDYKRLFCYFDLFPLVRYKNHIYLQIMCRSKGIGDDEIIGYMYFIFTEKLQIIFEQSSDITVDSN